MTALDDATASRQISILQNSVRPLVKFIAHNSSQLDRVGNILSYVKTKRQSQLQLKVQVLTNQEVITEIDEILPLLKDKQYLAECIEEVKTRDAEIVVDEKEEDLSLICGHKKPPSSSLSNGNSKIKKTFSMRSGSKQGLKS